MKTVLRNILFVKARLFVFLYSSYTVKGDCPPLYDNLRFVPLIPFHFMTSSFYFSLCRKKLNSFYFILFFRPWTCPCFVYFEWEQPDNEISMDEQNKNKSHYHDATLVWKITRIKSVCRQLKCVIIWKKYIYSDYAVIL